MSGQWALHTDTEWAVFYGGPDPDNCAGWRRVDDEVSAREEVQRYVAPNGIASRTVTYGPWGAEVIETEEPA